MTCAMVFVAVATALAVPAASAAPPTSRWIVTIAPAADPTAVARSVGAQSVRAYTSAMTGFAATLTEQQVSALGADSRVESLKRDETVATLPRRTEPRARGPVAPSTQFIPEGVRRIGGLQSPTARIDGRDQRLNADIAILDTGVSQHEDLNIAGGVNCTGDDIGLIDQFGHGTEVAGVAAAIDNRIGTVGSAPGARIWAVRIFGQTGELTLESLLCGLDYLQANARRIDVAVLAFENRGTPDAPCGRRRVQPTPGPLRLLPKFEVVDPVHAAICRVTAAGVTLVAAAGNDASDAGNFVPAAYPQMITVSAVTDTDGLRGGLGPAAFCFNTERDDTFASYSNFGAVVDISAPGTCVYTTFPGNQYTTDVGTSFAAPLVAGAVALIKARTPLLPPSRGARDPCWARRGRAHLR